MLSFTGTRIVRFRRCPRRPILPTLAFSDAPPWVPTGPWPDGCRSNTAVTTVVEGKGVLVIDDVFTEGFTIREVGRALTLAGAIEVSEVVLAREPWKSEVGRRVAAEHAEALGILQRHDPADT